MILTKIKIKNYKSIKNLELDLRSNNNGSKDEILLGTFKSVNNDKFIVPGYISLFGRNAIGKTSILEAISFVFDSLNGTLSNLAANQVLESYMGKKLSQNLLSLPNNLPNNNEIDEIRESIKKQKGEYFYKYMSILTAIRKNTYNHCAASLKEPIITELTFWDEKSKKEVGILYKHEKDIATIDYLNMDEKDKNNFNGYMRNIISVKRTYYSNFGNFTFLYPDTDNDFIFALQNLVGRIGKERTVKLLQLADKTITDIIINTLPNGLIQIRQVIVNGSRQIDLFSLSSGTRQFIVLASTFILLKDSKVGGIILIDELEINLHLELIDALKLLMNNLFEKNNIMTIFTTHSPISVEDSTKFKQIYSLESDGKETKVVKLSKKFKNTQSVYKRYVNGDLAFYPEKEQTVNVIDEVFNA